MLREPSDSKSCFSGFALSYGWQSLPHLFSQLIELEWATFTQVDSLYRILCWMLTFLLGLQKSTYSALSICQRRRETSSSSRSENDGFSSREDSQVSLSFKVVVSLVESLLGSTTYWSREDGCAVHWWETESWADALKKSKLERRLNEKRGYYSKKKGLWKRAE